MNRARNLFPLAGLAFASIIVVLSGCSFMDRSGSGYMLSISASSGTVSGTGRSWSFDAGTIPQYTTETVAFTVHNTGNAAFNAQGSVSFSNSDFTTDLGGSFTVQPGATNTFTGRFTPTGPIGQETGTLTLTPTNGDPIVISLRGTSDQSFAVLDQSGAQITNSTPPILIFNEIFTIQNNGSSTITLTGSPDFVVVGTLPGITVYAQPSSPIAPAGTTTFELVAEYGYAGNTDTVTITGTDSATGAPFTFSFQVTDNNLG